MEQLENRPTRMEYYKEKYQDCRMEQLENEPKTMEEYREKYQNYRKTIEKKTCKIKDLAEILDISMDKARRIARIETFPKVKIGRDTRIILSKLDEWLEEHIGECL